MQRIGYSTKRYKLCGMIIYFTLDDTSTGDRILYGTVNGNGH